MNTSRHILVVDDDDDQLSTLCRGLLYLGHVCVTARSAGEALGKLAHGDERVDVLLVDLSAPGKPGARIVEQAMCARPEMGVLVVTGLVLWPSVLTLAGRGLPILKKPFTPEQLGRAIRTAMNRHRTKGEET